jgi:hypothetical protein
MNHVAVLLSKPISDHHLSAIVVVTKAIIVYTTREMIQVANHSKAVVGSSNTHTASIGIVGTPYPNNTFKTFFIIPILDHRLKLHGRRPKDRSVHPGTLEPKRYMTTTTSNFKYEIGTAPETPLFKTTVHTMIFHPKWNTTCRTQKLFHIHFRSHPF